MQYVDTFRQLYQQRSGDEVLLELHRSSRSILGYVVTGIAPILLGIILSYVLHNYSYLWFCTGSLAIGLEALRVYHDDLYIFDREKITHRGGRLSLNYEVPVIRYSDIRSLEVVQSIIGRIFDYGNVSIGTAAQEGEELRIEGVRDPHQLSLALDELRILSTNPKTRYKSID